MDDPKITKTPPPDAKQPQALQAVSHPILEQRDVSLQVFRLDLLHPAINGNKWYKLKYNLQAARSAGYNTLLSFGGAWSNHIHALAWAGYTQGFNTIGVIRGEPAHGLTPTLEDARAWGMKLHFISRSDYRNKHDPAFQAALIKKFQMDSLEGASEDIHQLAGASEDIPTSGHPSIASMATGHPLTGKSDQPLSTAARKRCYRTSTLKPCFNRCLNT